MVVYQKFGVMGLSVIFSILQKLKFQIFRLFILYDNCKNSSDCMNSTSLPNKTDIVFEEESLSEFLYQSLLVNNCISVLPCIFLAAWSDKHGRKLLLTLPYIGSFITDIVLTISIFVPLVSRSVLLLAEAIYGIFGGTVLISIGCMCYITDATDHRLRTWFIGLYLGLLNTVPALDWIIKYYCTPLETGLPFQTLVLSAISIRIFFSVCFIIYIKKCISESVFILGSFEGNPWMNLLAPINVSDTVSCVFRRRLDNVRSFIIVALVIFIFYSTSLNGCIYAAVGFLMLVTQLISVSAYEALEKLCIEAGAPELVFLLSFGLITFGLLFFIYLRKVIAPELLGQLDSSECLALINRKGQIQQLYT